jgi:hypothetical protein
MTAAKISLGRGKGNTRTSRLTPAEFARAFQAKELARFGEYDLAVMQAAAAGARAIRSRVPVDQGELRRSTVLKVHGKPPGRSGVLVDIVEDTPYAAAQEFGSRPFMPPFEPLYEWAKRQAPNLGLNTADDEAIVAFVEAVRWSIKHHGIKAKWHTRDALPQLRRLLKRFLKRAAKSAGG